MGQTVEIVCDDCKYRRVYNLGRSTSKEPLNKILGSFDKDVSNTLKQLDSAYTMTEYDYGIHIMICSKCKELNTNLILKVKFNNDLEYIPKNFCYKCNVRLKSLENLNDIEKCNCPNCGSKSLKYKHVCNWD